MTRRYPFLSEAQAAELRNMYQVARRVGGWMPADHPDRQVSLKYTALLAGYIKAGYTRTELARAAGCKQFAIRSRLVRHGYLCPFPSERLTVRPYRGQRTPYDARRRVRGDR